MPTSTSALKSDLDRRLSSGGLIGDWALDPARSSVRFRTKAMWGLAPVKGEFSEFQGTGRVDPEGRVTGNLTVAVASVSTKVKKRDIHLRSADFFRAEQHPHMIFSVERVSTADGPALVLGTLEIAGKRRPLTVPMTFSTLGDGAIQLDATFPINRVDYGMNLTPMGASLLNTITVQAVFTRR